MNCYDEILKSLKSLKKEYPTRTIAQHLSTALADYGDFWGLPDKEFLFAIEKYASEQSLNTSSEDLDRIIKDAEDLSTILDEEDED